MSLSQAATADVRLAPGRSRTIGDMDLTLPWSLARSLWEHRRRQRDYQHLLELPDYLLEDAGLTRSQIKAAMRRRPV